MSLNKVFFLALRKRVSLIFATGIILFAASLPAHAAPQSAVRKTESRHAFISKKIQNALTKAAKNFRKHKTQSGVFITLPTKDSEIRVELEPYDIRARDYRSYYTDQQGRHPDPVQVELFREKQGTVEKGEFYRFALIEKAFSGKQEIFGYFRKNGVYYSLNPDPRKLERFEVSEARPEDFPKFSADSIVFKNSSSTESVNYAGAAPLAGEGKAEFKVVQIATIADFPYFQMDSNPNARILSILNGVDALYQTQLGVTLQVTSQDYWTTEEDDPFDLASYSALSLLNAFRIWAYGDYLITPPADPHFPPYNSQDPSKNYHLAHLFTGRSLGTGVAGSGYIAALCTEAPYAVSRYFSHATAVHVAAHEIGHNLGGTHAKCGSGTLMCSASTSNQFSTANITEIQNHLSTAFCLAPEPNNSPSLLPIAQQSAFESQAQSVVLNGTDLDGDPLTYTSSPENADIHIFGNVLTYTPSIGTVLAGRTSAQVQLMVRVNDSRGLFDEKPLTFMVYRPSWHNPLNAHDVNSDALVTDADSTILLNALNSDIPSRLPATPATYYLDVSGDGSLAPIDVLMVINEINRLSSGN